MKNNIPYVFFGTSEFSVYILDELLNANFKPQLIVTTPDKPKGRKLILTPSPVKQWAIKNNIPLLQPTKLSDPIFISKLSALNSPIFIIASYGKILPKTILDIPARGILNIHPSLLPKLRGAAPLETSILEDIRDTGVSIMRIDEEMDHGPIVAQEKACLSEWPMRLDKLEEILGKQGGALLTKILPDWNNEAIKPTEQKHSEATYTKKITKQDGLLDLTTDPYKNFLKIQAFYGWPGTYFFIEHKEKKIRVNISEASYKTGVLTIIKVIPEGKKEMKYEDFLRGL
ncbi:MAG: methionyl-tRNA formyltransferase [Candidatus Paceibacterota bacterium]